MTLQNIGLFCSASNSIEQFYFEEAQYLGKWIAENGKTLVYGGANLGLMECVAEQVSEKGGTIVGIIPEKMYQMGRHSLLPSDLIRTSSLQERKQLIIGKADIVIALPGGVGTFDEIFEFLVGRFLHEHRKTILIVDINGYFQGLKLQIEQMIAEEFVYDTIYDYCIFVDSVEEAIQTLEDLTSTPSQDD